jgi:transposase InsO family protein
MNCVKYTALEKFKALQMWTVGGKDLFYVIHKFKCSRRSLFYWKKEFDGTLDSLKNKTFLPHNCHPASHTEFERMNILFVLSENENISYCELFGKLRRDFDYKRSYWGMCKYIRKNVLRADYEKQAVYVPQPYNTPKNFGVKMQLDVKYVPLSCCAYGKIVAKQYYQYSIIDEATRERFLCAYEEHTAENSVDFVKRAVKFFGYVPQLIQTDNGKEFTNFSNQKKSVVDILLNDLHIRHKLIKPRTPRHNGKIERSHRKDQEWFYDNMKYYSFNDLQNQISAWLIRYNDIPISVLRTEDCRKSFLSPNEKRKELEQLGMFSGRQIVLV